MNALALFLTCALSPLLAFADAEFEALKAIKLKAEKGNAEAQFILAVSYAEGKAVPKNDIKAV